VAWDTDQHLEAALLGALGPQEVAEADAYFDTILEGEYGEEAEELLAQRQQAQGPTQEEEIAAAEERQRDFVHDQLDALEERIGRGLTPTEEDQFIDEASVGAPESVNLVRDHAEALKAKLDNRQDRVEIGASAVRRLGEEEGSEEVDPDEITRQVGTMSERQKRVERGAFAVTLARDGVSMDDVDQMIADEAAGEEGDEE
jgi:hypothetical protein